MSSIAIIEAKSVLLLLRLACLCEQIVSDENEARQRTASPAGEDFDRLHPGQRVSLPLQRSLKARSTAGTRGANGAVETPRFTAVVMDAAGRMADAAYQQCCVFIVPQVSMLLHMGSCLRPFPG